MRMLDLFCGRWGWSEAFVKRGWECIEKIGNHVWLHFTVRDMLGRALWDWAFYSFMRSVWASFEECQGELAIEEKGKAAGK